MNSMVMTDKNISIKKIRSQNFMAFAGAIGSFTAGAFLMLTGLILSLIKYLDKINFHGWDTWMIAVSFPLFALGAHCLDLIEQKKNKMGRNLKSQNLEIK